jgi:hypothetical protein
MRITAPYMVLEFRLGVQAGTAHPLLRRESFDQTAALAAQRPLEA